MNRKQCRILVIDENREASRGLQVFLKYLGHHVMAAEGAGEGLELARRLTPDCVICSIGLRGSNGFSLARRLREDGRTASAWLIGVSGLGSSAFEDLKGESCFDRFLLRPVGLPGLEEALAPHCGHVHQYTNSCCD